MVDLTWKPAGHRAERHQRPFDHAGGAGGDCRGRDLARCKRQLAHPAPLLDGGGGAGGAGDPAPCGRRPALGRGLRPRSLGGKGRCSYGRRPLGLAILGRAGQCRKDHRKRADRCDIAHRFWPDLWRGSGGVVARGAGIADWHIPAQGLGLGDHRRAVSGLFLAACLRVQHRRVL